MEMKELDEAVRPVSSLSLAKHGKTVEFGDNTNLLLFEKGVISHITFDRERI